jgi:hypothetical protein
LSLAVVVVVVALPVVLLPTLAKMSALTTSPPTDGIGIANLPNQVRGLQALDGVEQVVTRRNGLGF